MGGAARRRTLSFYDGRTCLGSIEISAKGKCAAFDAKRRRLGSFKSQRRAIEAIERAQMLPEVGCK
jgi:hypothetical protein